MSNLTAWLMVGQSKSKKAQRRARWNHVVLYAPVTEEQRLKLAMEVFADELEEDRV
jgi:hypothetical protein